MEVFKVDKGLEIHHDSDLPARSGLGSSSAFTVGMLSALYALNGRIIPKVDLAKEAIRVERYTGTQDLYILLHMGPVYFLYRQNNASYELCIIPLVEDPMHQVVKAN